MIATHDCYSWVADFSMVRVPSGERSLRKWLRRSPDAPATTATRQPTIRCSRSPMTARRCGCIPTVSAPSSMRRTTGSISPSACAGTEGQTNDREAEGYAQRTMMLLTATFSELNQGQTSSAAHQASTKGQLVFENEHFSRSRMRPILKRCGGDGRRRKRNGIVMLITSVSCRDTMTEEA